MELVNIGTWNIFRVFSFDQGEGKMQQERKDAHLPEESLLGRGRRFTFLEAQALVWTSRSLKKSY